MSNMVLCACTLSIPSPAFIVVDFLMLTILTVVRRYHIVPLTHSSLILMDAQHLFMCFMANSMSSLGKCPLKSCAPISLGFFIDVEVHKLAVHLVGKFLVSVFANISIMRFVCRVSGVLCCANTFKEN